MIKNIMIRTQVYLPEDLYNELKLLASTGKKTFSQLIREGVEVVVKRKKKRKKKFGEGFIGAIKGGPKDLSKNIDYYLYVEPYEKKEKKK
ncbi:hypothetical protein A2Z22_03460 [Candidatus Woesebacteria bacterium RBG_16_34_12]|uniref:CopG-like ribbon-helix-helix domain-containing protein n=1 Tax=Candidatus Woesebacteria bacterium RBG_16_34_12 TaxID=1802480 RepID=A0A1F7XAT6_9BACT|nr:MAG: hypothetical protein A2Z22_03460 [Candidatus Woesebacteria bacterium RBG_16_34_12]